jgi:hypothetical protein
MQRMLILPRNIVEVIFISIWGTYQRISSLIPEKVSRVVILQQELQ